MEKVKESQKNINRPKIDKKEKPGSKKFILAKNWSKDPLFVVTSFLSILCTSYEFSIGHAFHLFKLIFSLVTSFVLLSEEKISTK